MSVRIVSQMNRLQMEGSIENKDAAKEGLQAAISQQRTAINDTHDARLTKVSKNEEARAWSGNSRLVGTTTGAVVGTVVLGPGVGTAAGAVVGALVGDGVGELGGLPAKKAANQADKEAGLAELRYGKSSDRFDAARDRVEDAAQRQEEIDRFSRELRELGWAGTP